MPAAPAFWGERPGLLANLLSPIGAAWDAAGRWRAAVSRPYRPPVPVVCIGNLVAGGAGKTPVTMALASLLAARGVALHIVARGYGGRLGGPVRVDTSHHDPNAVGDEALLLAAHAPAWVARDRAAGARAAAEAGARIILLDDGLQNPKIHKDLSLLVVDAGYGFGNGRVIPAGPLRERLARGLSRADAVVLLDPGAGVSGLDQLAARGLPVMHASVVPIAGERLSGSRLLAFAGIGRPEKFFAMLRSLDVDLVDTRPFPDHHRYRGRELARLVRDAERMRARLVTTAKDIVRVPAPRRPGIEVLDIEVHWRDPAALVRLMKPLWVLP
jgi:tetraacyldisaccharide 4'-kinase